MARGRKSSSSNISILPGASTENANEPGEVHRQISKKLRPRTLDKDEKKVWNRLGPQLVMLGRLRPHYIDAFADYCYLFCKLKKLRKELDDDTWFYVVQSRNGSQHKSLPQVAQANEIWRQLRSHIGEFGLAPSSDKNLNNNQGDLFDNEFAALNDQSK